MTFRKYTTPDFVDLQKYSVIIDSSVWIEYFKWGGMPKLDRLIEEDLACINEFILPELAPY